MAELAWFVLACMSGSEARISQHATRHQCEGYYPIEQRYLPRTHRTHFRREIVVRPAMPGYVFMQMPAKDPPFTAFLPHHMFHHYKPDEPIRWGQTIPSDYWPTEPPPVDGPIEFLGDEYGPKQIAIREVEIFKQREASGEFNYTVKRGSQWLPKAVKIGARVAVQSHLLNVAWGHIEGAIERIKENLKVDVVFERYEKTVRAEVPIANLRFLT